MLCCVYTLLYTMGMERRMTKKEEVVSCVQRLAAAAPEKREVGAKYSGVDPEVPNGVDNSFYPRPRTFSLNVGFNF